MDSTFINTQVEAIKMANKKQATTKDLIYNKKRIPLFRVEIIPSDDAKLLIQIKEDMKLLGTPKEAIIKMHKKLKEQGFFVKEKK